MRHQFAICSLLLTAVVSMAQAQEAGYSNYREAMAAGASLYNAGKLAESRAPLEAAAKVAESDSDKCRIHQTLVVVYAEGGDFPKMYDSAEFVIEHAPYPAMASLTCRALLGHVHKKGQAEAARKRYEQRLLKNGNDRTAMYVMSNYHGLLDRDFAQQAKYFEGLIHLNKDEGKDFDFEVAGKLAFAYRLSNQFVESAELYEKIAPLHKDETSWDYKEAALAWLKAGQKDRALAAAKKADELGADARSERAIDNWHADLGEVFLANGEGPSAVKHYELAIEKTKADFYKKKFSAELEKAKKL